MGLPLILYAGCCTLWVVFYYQGCRLSLSDRNYPIWLPLTITITGLILSYFETKYLVSNYGSGYGIKLSSFIYSFGCILLLLSRKIEIAYHSRLFGRIIEWIGRHSFVIYLFHCYLIFLLDKAPVEIPWLVRWIIIVFLSLWVVLMIKLIPSKVRYYIGLYD